MLITPPPPIRVPVLIRLMWAYASCGHHDHTLFQGLAEAAAAQLQQRSQPDRLEGGDGGQWRGREPADRLEARDVSALLWAVATWQVSRTEVWQAGRAEVWQAGRAEVCWAG